MFSDRSGLDAGDLLFAHPEALQEPEKLLAAYFSSPTTGLCILDCELRYLAINNALANMNGLPAASHIGKTVREVLGEVGSAIEAGVQRVLATEEPVTYYEVSLQLSTRSEVGHWVEHFFPIKDQSEKVKRIAVVVIEVTEQKRLEQSLQNIDWRLGSSRSGCRC